MVKKASPVVIKKSNAPIAASVTVPKQVRTVVKAMAKMNAGPISASSKPSIPVGPNPNNLFEILSNTNGESRERERHGVINAAINDIEFVLSQNRQLIDEIGNLLRPVLNGAFVVDAAPEIAFDSSNSSTTLRLYDLAERARGHNRLLTTIIEALEL